MLLFTYTTVPAPYHKILPTPANRIICLDVRVSEGANSCVWGICGLSDFFAIRSSSQIWKLAALWNGELRGLN